MLRRSQKTSLELSADLIESKEPIVDPDEKSELSKFDIYYDDSSDEDDIDEKITNYSIRTSWKQYEKENEVKAEKKGFINNDFLLSFVGQAGGIRLFYSKEVNKTYYPLKRTILSEKKAEESPQYQLKHLFKSSLINSATKSLESVATFLLRAECKEGIRAKFQTAAKKIIIEFSSEIEPLIARYIADIIKWCSLVKFDNNTEKPEAILQFEKNASTLLLNLFKKYSLFAKGDDDREIVIEELSSLAKNLVSSISKKLSFNKVDKAAGKKKALTALQSYPTKYKNILKLMKSILTKCAARGYVSSMLEKEIAQDATNNNLVKAYIEDLIQLRKVKIKKMRLSIPEEEAFKKYYTINDNNLSYELTINFIRFQQVNSLIALRSFRRPTLGRSHLFVSSNPIQFYANLRLANRSQSRLIANSRYSIFANDRLSSRIWRLNEEFKDHTDVHETQAVLKSLGRRDRVDDVGNYATIYEEIKKIKEYFTDKGEVVTDAKIAEWMQEIFQGTFSRLSMSNVEESECLHKLQSITYLLLGCEAVRNPAMHVINQMLLDLIVADETWTFEEVLTNTGDKCMPMAPEGAVAIARYLTSDYRKSMPHSYFYRGVEDKTESSDKFNKKDLVKFEATIVRAWLKLTDANIKAANSSQFAENIFSHIEEHFKKWLGEKSSMSRSETDIITEERSKLRM